MKEVIIFPGPRAEIIDSPIPKPTADQIVIKVVVSGSNPKDWKVDWLPEGLNQGDDIAGIVHEVGANITEFKPGDRVCAFHEMLAQHGSYAEYAVAWGYSTFHLPKQISFEEASTIPLAGLTAASGMYRHLGLPQPWVPAETPIPLIVYGASSAVGAFAVKLAALSNIHPIIAVAGKGEKYVSTMLDKSKGDAIVDYRNGDEAVVQGIRDALKAAGAGGASYAFDAISEHGSYLNIHKVLEPQGKIALVLSAEEGVNVPASMTHTFVMVGVVHGIRGIKPGGKEFGYVFLKYFGRALELGIFSGHPYEVVPGGLGGVGMALENLKAGKASAFKYVFRIADTEGVAGGDLSS